MYVYMYVCMYMYVMYVWLSCQFRGRYVVSICIQIYIERFHESVPKPVNVCVRACVCVHVDI